MSFSCKKGSGDLHPRLLGFPSKSVKLTVEPTFIFRSDSNGEDLEGFAGAGLYESIPMDSPAQSFVDYSGEPIVNDAKFREGILRKIAEVGIAVEKALGTPQDIEGVVMGGEVYVVQTRRVAVALCWRCVLCRACRACGDRSPSPVGPDCSWRDLFSSSSALRRPQV